MIKEHKPVGTVLYGRAMAAQLASEASAYNVNNPVIITEKRWMRKAARLGRMLSSAYFGNVRLCLDEAPEDCDFLILAGGKTLTDRFRDDRRPRAHVPLASDHLEELTGPQAELLLIDRAFIGKSKVPARFFLEFAQGANGGDLIPAPADTLPASFTYHNRTAVYSGHNALEILPHLLTDRKIVKPLVLTDKGIIAVGLMDILNDALAGIEPVVFSDIPPDSRIDVVNGISSLYREKGCDGIIAFGGGSVLDTAKGVNLNVSLGVDDLNTMVGSGHLPVLKTPFIAVPTTSGTGSEVTKVAVISDPQKGRKLLFNSDTLQPDCAVLDSRLTASLPPFLTSITGMDAMTHAVEAYTCLGKNPISDHQAWTAVSLIREHLPAVMDDPTGKDHRKALAIASNLAGAAFSNSMVGMVHTVGHSIGSVCHAPHGSCMSVLLPHVLDYNFKAIEPLLAELLEAVAGPEVFHETERDKRAERTIEEIRKMNRLLREKTGERHPEKLRELVDREGNPLVTPDQFSEIARVSLGDASIVYNPVEIREKDVIALLEKAY